MEGSTFIRMFLVEFLLCLSWSNLAEGYKKDGSTTASGWRMDVGFAVDRHESIDNETWHQMLNFVAQFSAEVQIEATGSRMGLVSFDEISTLDIALNDHNNTDDLQADIRGQTYGGFGRDLSLGIYRLREDLFTRIKGDRADYANVAVLITNGESSPEPAIVEAELLRQSGASLICIGVGDRVDMELLTALSGGEHNTLTVASFDDLPSLMAPLATRVTRALSVLQCDVDVCVALARSVSPEDWSASLTYAHKMAWLSDLNIRHNRVGVVTYDDISTLDIPLNKHSNSSSFREDVAALPHGGSGCNLAHALFRIRTECFSMDQGDRPGISNVAIVVVNGNSDFRSAVAEAELLRESGAMVLTVGVGDAINLDLLVNISTGGAAGVFQVAGFQELEANPDITLPVMCHAPTITSTTTTTTTASTTTSTSTTTTAPSTPKHTSGSTTPQPSSPSPTSNRPTSPTTSFDHYGMVNTHVVIIIICATVIPLAVIIGLIVMIFRRRTQLKSKTADGKRPIQQEPNAITHEGHTNSGSVFPAEYKAEEYN